MHCVIELGGMGSKACDITLLKGYALIELEVMQPRWPLGIQG